MIQLRKLLFTKRLKQQHILDFANRDRSKKPLHQSRLSCIINGKMNATESEKHRIRDALIFLGVPVEKICKVAEIHHEESQA